MLHRFLALADRRTALTMMGLAAGAAAGPALARRRGRKAFDPADPADHLRAYIKMTASEEDGAETRLVYEGVTYGITEGLRMRPLYGMLGYGPVRTFLQPDGSRRILATEAAVFTDLATGKVLETWANPYLDDRKVEVWHLRTGPVNFAIDPNKPINAGGWRLLRQSDQGAGRFFLPTAVQDGHLVLTIDAQAERKNPLDPAKWPAESTGATMRYSEHNTWRAQLADVENYDIPSPAIFAAWHTNKEWRPWMLMGQRPGHIYNHLTAYKVKSIAEAPRVLVDHYEKHAPEFLSSPREWTGGYQTDWGHFMRNRKPALTQ